MLHKNIKSLIFYSYKYRLKILDLSQTVGALHIGGSFSSTEIINVIFNKLKKKEDVFILSKGHCGVLQYVILREKKIISEKFLRSYCQKNSKLGVHPDYGNPGIEASTGSLAHGLGLAMGMSIANKKKKFFLILSDGELMEGSTWEYALTASSLNLKNITVFIDCNGLQSATWSKDTHPTLEPIKQKFKSFGWQSETCDGHDIRKIIQCYNSLNLAAPKAIICKTIKGFPVPFMSNVPMWHYRSPNKMEFNEAKIFLKNFYKIK
jgi:transketolase